MFSIILIMLVVIIAVVLLYAVTRPNDFVTTRTADIQGPAGSDLPADQRFQPLAHLVAL